MAIFVCRIGTPDDRPPREQVEHGVVEPPLAGLVDGGTLFVQTAETDPEAIFASLPAAARPGGPSAVQM